MSLCPKDGKGCPDDLCHGSGCVRMGGYPMLDVCHVCNGTIDHEIPECGTCTCDNDDDGFYNDQADHEGYDEPPVTNNKGEAP